MRIKNDKKIRLGELADLLQADLSDPESANAVVSTISDIDNATESAMVFVTNEEYLARALASPAASILAPKGLPVAGKPALAVDNVWKSVLQILDLFFPEEPAPAGIHCTAVVHPTARIAPTASIGPQVVVEEGADIAEGVEIGAQCFIGRNARIGEGTLLHPGVRVLDRVEVGRRVILHPGVVLGADGYGYKLIDGKFVKLPQVGIVVVEDDVEVGANTCIDRATFGETRIGAGTKIDNLVQIAHNCRIGRSCGMAAQVGFAGSVRTGDFCMFWGQVGVADQLKIGSGVVVMAQSGIKDDVPDGAQIFGSPAQPVKESARMLAAQKQLPDILKRLRSLEKKVG